MILLCDKLRLSIYRKGFTFVYVFCIYITNLLWSKNTSTRKKDLNPFCSIFQFSFLSLGLLCCSKLIDLPSTIPTTIFFTPMGTYIIQWVQINTQINHGLHIYWPNNLLTYSLFEPKTFYFKPMFREIEIEQYTSLTKNIYKRVSRALMNKLNIVLHKTKLKTN